MPTIDKKDESGRNDRKGLAGDLRICNPAGHLQMEKRHRNANCR